MAVCKKPKLVTTTDGNGNGAGGNRNGAGGNGNSAKISKLRTKKVGRLFNGSSMPCELRISKRLMAVVQ